MEPARRKRDVLEVLSYHSRHEQAVSIRDHPVARTQDRLVMAPLARRFAPEGVRGSASADCYRRRAEGRAGLILSEGTFVNRPASFRSNL